MYERVCTLFRQINEMRGLMFWLDLCLSSLFLWGGISGYLVGWKISLRQLTALAATFVTAAALKGDMKQFITVHYPIEDTIKALINSRIAMPVDSISSFHSTRLVLNGLPAVIQKGLVEKVAFASAPGASGMAELLAVVMLNALAFMAAAILWWSVFHLAGTFWPGSKGRPFKYHDHWAGFLVGAVRQMGLIILVVGAAAPFLWVPAFPKDIFDPQQAVLVRWSLLLFNDTGIWWN